MDQDSTSRRLLFHGLVVFVLGLCSGLAMLGPPTAFHNLRLALSAHLVGVTTGLFLLAVGLLLDRVRLSPGALAVTFWLVLYGAYGNWGGTMLGAVLGTHTMTSIAGAGASHVAANWQEALVGFVLTSSGAGALVACFILLWGLRAGGKHGP